MFGEVPLVFCLPSVKKTCQHRMAAVSIIFRGAEIISYCFSYLNWCWSHWFDNGHDIWQVHSSWGEIYLNIFLHICITSICIRLVCDSPWMGIPWMFTEFFMYICISKFEFAAPSTSKQATLYKFIKIILMT